MPVPPSIIPAKRRVHRKRHQVAIAPPAPSTVSVVSVVRVDAGQALWTFSAAIVGEPSVITGLLVGEYGPVGSEGVTPEGAILLAYDTGVSVGDPWLCAAGFVTINFAGGGTLVDGAGVVS